MSLVRATVFGPAGAALLCAACQAAPPAAMRVGEDCALRTAAFAELSAAADWIALGSVTRVRSTRKAGGLFEGHERGWAAIRLDRRLAGAKPPGSAHVDWSYAWSDAPPFGGGLKPSPGDAYVAWRKAGVVDGLPAECVTGLPWPAGVRSADAGASAARRLGIPPPK